MKAQTRDIWLAVAALVLLWVCIVEFVPARNNGDDHRGKVPPVLQPTPVTVSTKPSLSLDRSVYLRSESVICPEALLEPVYMKAFHKGGEDAGHTAVTNLFFDPPGNCIRVGKTVKVRVLDQSVSPHKLASIFLCESCARFVTLPDNLQN